MIKHAEVTDRIINACYKVYNTLGSGFLEKVYENALKVELLEQGLQVEQQRPIAVWYAGQQVGEYFADLVVNDVVVLELKAQDALATIHEVQILNYLKATHHEVGLLINFGPKIEIKRKINSKKPR